jgi:hypothetical protein
MRSHWRNEIHNHYRLHGPGFTDMVLRIPTFAALLLTGSCLAADGHPLVYSTFLGGSNDDQAYAVTIDRDGNAYVAGQTSSTNFPVLNAWQPENAGQQDAFLAKFDPNGRLLFSTYFGGSGEELAEAVAVDDAGNIYVVGYSTSVDLPTTPGAFQEEYGGGTAFGTGDGFIARFSNDGSELLYCTYLGGRGDDHLIGIAIDGEGNIVVSGTTDSAPLPGTTVIGLRGRQDIFVCKLNPSGEQFLWSTIIAGNSQEWVAGPVLGPDNAIYFAGLTASTNLPVTVNAQQPSHQSPGEDYWGGFFGILEPDGSALRYLSYFGRGLFTRVHDLTITRDGAVLITGRVASSETPPSEIKDVFQRNFGGGSGDAFVARLNPADWSIEWFSYLGGSGEESANGIVLDADENIYVTGTSASSNFPLKDSLAKERAGPQDVFLVKISADGKALAYSTFLGGSDEETPFRIAIGPDNLPVIVGATTSKDFPVRNAAFPSFTGGEIGLFSPVYHDAFVTKIKPGPVPPRLEISRSGNFVLLSWPADAEGFVLDASGNSGGGEWKVAPGAPLVLGSQKAVITRPAEAARFYRLRRP